MLIRPLLAASLLAPLSAQDALVVDLKVVCDRFGDVVPRTRADGAAPGSHRLAGHSVHWLLGPRRFAEVESVADVVEELAAARGAPDVRIAPDEGTCVADVAATLDALSTWLDDGAEVAPRGGGKLRLRTVSDSVAGSGVMIPPNVRGPRPPAADARRPIIEVHQDGRIASLGTVFHRASNAADGADELDALLAAVRSRAVRDGTAVHRADGRLEVRVLLHADRWAEFAFVGRLLSRAARDAATIWQFDLAVLGNDVESRVCAAAADPVARSPRAPAASRAVGARIAVGRDVGPAIDWLVRQQAADGSFADLADVTAERRVETTAWALLALLESGSTMRSGPYRDAVKRATVSLSPSLDDPVTAVTPAAHLGAYALATLAVARNARVSAYRLLNRRARRAAEALDAARDASGLWGTRTSPTDVALAVLAWSEVRAIDREPVLPDLRPGLVRWLADRGIDTPLAIGAALWAGGSNGALRDRALRITAAIGAGHLDLEGAWLCSLGIASIGGDVEAWTSRLRREVDARAAIGGGSFRGADGPVRTTALVILATAPFQLR